jgi:hypothetical protein
VTRPENTGSEPVHLTGHDAHPACVPAVDAAAKPAPSELVAAITVFIGARFQHPRAALPDPWACGPAPEPRGANILPSICRAQGVAEIDLVVTRRTDCYGVNLGLRPAQ